jgi:SSS family solute:Na+ symporter
MRPVFAAPPHSSVLTPADWVILFLYVLALAAIAYSAARQVRAPEDYFLAGRRMSRWPIALSMYVALFSTNSFLGLTGWLNRPHGTIWIGLNTVGLILAVPIVVKLYPDIFFRLRITTAYEYLERRFDYATRALGSVLFLSFRVTWMATMIYAASLLVSHVLGWTEESGPLNGPVCAILLLGALGTAFALAGGIRSVIWTDVMQFFVLFGGVLVMGGIAIHASGGIQHAFSVALQAGKFEPPHLFSWTEDLTFVSALSLGFFAYLSNAGADQVLLQTYLTARSAPEAKSSLLRNGFLLKPLSLLFPALGVLFFVYYRAHPALAAALRVPDDALPVFVTQVLPSGIRGLVIAAIMAAVLSGWASGLTALTTCVQVDFVRRWQKRQLSDRSALLLARFLALLWGILVSVGALGVRHLGGANNIIQILNILMYPFAGVLLGIFLLGLLTRRGNPPGAAIGVACGFLATVGAPLLQKLLQSWPTAARLVPPFLQAKVHALSGISNFYYAALGTLTTFAAGYLSSLFFASPPPQKLQGLTHAQGRFPARQNA